MRLPVLCKKCEFEHSDLTEYLVEVLDQSIYELECNRGHRTMMIWQIEKFELLFDMGTKALVDGYTREAVVNFASSLERYYEFCIEVFCEFQNIKHDEYLKTWKEVRKQSERQFGAYIFMYLNYFQNKPTLVSDEKTSFRNRVIHQGYIPTFDEVMMYANEVFSILKLSLIEMRREFKNEIDNIISRHLNNLRLEAKNDNCIIVGDPNVIVLNSDDWMEDNYNEAYDKIKQSGFRLACG